MGGERGEGRRGLNGNGKHYNKDYIKKFKLKDYALFFKNTVFNEKPLQNLTRGTEITGNGSIEDGQLHGTIVARLL